MGLTYKKAGVDVAAGDQFTSMIRKLVEETWLDGGREIGGFAGGGKIPYNAKKVIGAVDGVGTKIHLVSLMGVWNTIGIDAVAMSAMDVYAKGGMPAFLYDYLVVKHLDPNLHIKLIEGIVKGCLLAGCRLAGGETAEHPFNWLPRDYFDIATFCAGFQNKKLTPKIYSIKPGMKVYGWLSYGLGSNGYSLARKVLSLDGRARPKLFKFHSSLSCTLGKALLCPTEIHIQNIEKARKNKKYHPVIKAHAHITGGGLVGNIPRILPKDCRVVLDRSKWQRPPIFKLIQEEGWIKEDEMDKTFNQGIQVVTVVSSGEIRHQKSRLIGIVEERQKKEPQVQFIGKFQE